MRHAIRDAKTGKFCKAEVKAVKKANEDVKAVIGYMVTRKNYYKDTEVFPHPIGSIIHNNKQNIRVYKSIEQALYEEYLISSDGDLAIIFEVSVIGVVKPLSNDVIKTDKVCVTKILSYRDIASHGLYQYTYKNLTTYFTNINDCHTALNHRCCIAQLGDYSTQVATDMSRQYMGGNYSTAVATNSDSDVTSEGKNNILAALGKRCRVKGKKGNVIFMVEYEDKGFKIKNCLSAIIDGKKLKEDTWYTIKDGKFVEADTLGIK